MRISEELAHKVRQRAGGRCQYCLMHESLQGATFHIEHVIPQCKGGRSELENLALACPGCNLHKASKTHAIDSESGEDVPLFHPNLQLWSAHFRFDGYHIVGVTHVGRATIEVLDLNQPRRQRIREAEEVFCLYPPPQ